MARHRMNLIGPFGLFTPDGKRIEVASKKSVAMLALLGCAPNGVRTRVWLQNMLWGTRGQEQAQASLRRELSTLIKQLKAYSADHLILRETQRVGLALDQIDIDILALMSDTLPRKLPLQGDVLEGLDLRDCDGFEDWLRDERRRIRDLDMADFETRSAAPSFVQGSANGHSVLAESMLEHARPKLPPKPSLAILPFDDFSTIGHTAENQMPWLGIAMADEVAMLLSQFPQLFIVSSASARALAAEGVSVVDIAAQLGVRYILGGSIQRNGQQLRASVQLMEGRSGEQIWGQGFNGDMHDVHRMQQDIAQRIAPQIWTKVDLAERNHSLRHNPISIDNYELYWRANALFRSWQRDDILESIALMARALDQDGSCAWCASLSAFCHGVAYMLNYTEDRDASRRAAIRDYKTALRYGEDNAEVLGYVVGTLVVIGGDIGVADRLVTHALHLLPQHQPTLFWGGWVDLVCGNTDRARERFDLALRLNPATGVRSQTLCGLGFAALLGGNIKDAHLFLTEAIQSTPAFFLAPMGLCVAASMMGDQDMALGCAQMLQHQDYSIILGMIQNPQHRMMLQSVVDHNILQLMQTPQIA